MTYMVGWCVDLHMVGWCVDLHMVGWCVNLRGWVVCWLMLHPMMVHRREPPGGQVQLLQPSVNTLRGTQSCLADAAVVKKIL